MYKKVGRGQVEGGSLRTTARPLKNRATAHLGSSKKSSVQATSTTWKQSLTTTTDGLQLVHHVVLRVIPLQKGGKGVEGYVPVPVLESGDVLLHAHAAGVRGTWARVIGIVAAKS
jgi:hypothetical protein